MLTRKERETLSAPQGEKEKAVRQQLCARSALLEAQLYDTINAYTKLFIMNDASIPADLRKKLNAELEQFNSQTTQTLMDKSTDCVRQNTSAEQMAEELLAVFNKAASCPVTSTEPICRQAGIICCIVLLRQATVNPTLYNIANWLTLGTADTVKGAVTPEKPLSLEHWLDSIGVVSIALGAYELAQKYAPAAIDDVAAFENAAAQNAAEINLPEDALIVRDTKYLDESGHVDYLKYALDDGFVAGTKHIETLDVGALIDRYGGPGGDFTAPKGTPYKMRSLPYYKNQNVYHIYRVIKPIENVEAGTIAPAFGEPGGGIQYKLPAPIEKLLGEYLEEVTQ